MSDLVIRKASLDDVKGIVDVHCSIVDKWYKFTNGKRVEASYEELSVVERWDHGGPWMSIESCAIHLNYVLVNNQYPLVAVLDNRIVGELELYIGYEKGVLGRHGYIDILVVHRSYQGRGIGRKLVEKAIEICMEKECDTIAVWPDPSAVEFYKKVGLDQIAYRIKYVRIDLLDTKPLEPVRVSDFPEEYDLLSNWYFVSPRIESSYVAWLKSRWDYAVELEAMKTYEVLIDRDIALILESVWRSTSEASLYLWVRDRDLINEALEKAMGIAKYMGFNKLRASVTREIYERVLKNYKHEVSSDYIVLYKTLKH
ncbi:MAG: GNAT family N-acetyltransferase [Thermoprotei archaeon]